MIFEFQSAEEHSHSNIITDTRFIKSEINTNRHSYTIRNIHVQFLSVCENVPPANTWETMFYFFLTSSLTFRKGLLRSTKPPQLCGGIGIRFFFSNTNPRCSRQRITTICIHHNCMCNAIMVIHYNVQIYILLQKKKTEKIVYATRKKKWKTTKLHVRKQP